MHGLYCMSEGERWLNLWRHTVYLVVVMHELGRYGGLVNVWTLQEFLMWH